MQKSLYEVLGVHKLATPAEIKAAFRSRSRYCHPDAPGGSDAAFHELSHAYNILMSPKDRVLYDQTGDRGEKNAKQMQLDMIGMVAQVLAMVASDPYVQVSPINFVNGMKSTFAKAMVQYKKDIASSEKELTVYRRLSKQVQRKDSGKNIFDELCQSKIEWYEEGLAKMQYELRLSMMILDELNNYSEIGDVVRHFQAGFYSVEPFMDDEDEFEGNDTKGIDPPR